jgi:hypothetical protein
MLLRAMSAAPQRQATPEGSIDMVPSLKSGEADQVMTIKRLPAGFIIDIMLRSSVCT